MKSQKSKVPPSPRLRRASKSQKGFTLIEVMTIVVISIIFITLAVAAFNLAAGGSDLDNSAEEIIDTLRLAQNKTLSSEGASQWGVYFTTSTTPHKYILFRGSSYAARVTSSEEIHTLKGLAEISSIDMAGNDVVFEKITGMADRSGRIVLRLRSDISKTKTVYIETSGRAGLSATSTSSDDNRLKDSRHTHFDYGRLIDTSTTTSEILGLIFSSGGATTTENITISDNMEGSQFYWSGLVNVGGSIQAITIHSHNLNDYSISCLGSPCTVFCVHRDKRYNDKALQIKISGDASGFLIQYAADGQTATGTSIYVAGPIWQ